MDSIALQNVLHEKFPGGRHEGDNVFGSSTIATTSTDGDANSINAPKKLTSDNEVGAGYELTVGVTTKHFCWNFLAPPHLLAGTLTLQI